MHIYTRIDWPFGNLPIRRLESNLESTLPASVSHDGGIQELAESMGKPTLHDGHYQSDKASGFIDPLVKATFENLTSSIASHSGYFTLRKPPNHDTPNVEETGVTAKEIDAVESRLKKAINFILSQWESLSLLALNRSNETVNEATWRITFDCLIAFFFNHDLTRYRPNTEELLGDPNANYITSYAE